MKDSYLLKASEHMMLGGDSQAISRDISDGMIYVMSKVTEAMLSVNPLDMPLLSCAMMLLLDVFNREMPEESKGLTGTLYNMLKDRDNVRIKSVDMEELMKQLIDEKNGH